MVSSAGIKRNERLLPRRPFRCFTVHARLRSSRAALPRTISSLAFARQRRVAAGGELSLATLSELQSGESLSEAAQKDLFQHDPEYVKEVVAQRQNAEEQLLKQMEEKTAEMRFNNTLRRAGGNEHAARRMIEAEDQQNARHQQQLHEMRGGN